MDSRGKKRNRAGSQAQHVGQNYPRDGILQSAGKEQYEFHDKKDSSRVCAT
jgi:hypothetical protein